MQFRREFRHPMQSPPGKARSHVERVISTICITSREILPQAGFISL